MHYLLDRLREPGTMRSLVWVLLSLAGLATTEEALAHYALIGTVILGLVSALMPERKPAVVVKPADPPAEPPR